MTDQHLITFLQQVREGKLGSLPIWFLLPGGSVFGIIYTAAEEKVVLEKHMAELQQKASTGEQAESPGDLANQMYLSEQRSRQAAASVTPPGPHLIELYDVRLLVGGFEQRMFSLTVDLHHVAAWSFFTHTWQFKPGSGDEGPLTRFLHSL